MLLWLWFSWLGSDADQTGGWRVSLFLTHWLGDSDKVKELVLLRARRGPYDFYIIVLHSARRRWTGRRPLLRTQWTHTSGHTPEVLEGRVRTENCTTAASSSPTCPLPSLLSLLHAALILHYLSGVQHQMQVTHKHKGLETKVPQIQWFKY